MVYLLHFNEPYKHACHYLGFCENGNLESRIEMHKKGNGSKLMRVLKQNKIGFLLARVWKDGDRNFERKLKNQGHSKKLCPICLNK